MAQSSTQTDATLKEFSSLIRLVIEGATRKEISPQLEEQLAQAESSGLIYLVQAVRRILTGAMDIDAFPDLGKENRYVIESILDGIHTRNSDVRETDELALILEKLPKGAYPPFLRRINKKQLSDIAHAKRFVQRYKADPVFRKLVAQDPCKAARDYDIQIDPEEIRPLWDYDARSEHLKKRLPMTSITELCLQFDREVMVTWSMRHRSGAHFTHPRVRAWWERQVARGATELGPEINANDIHAPACFELCSGCTVGCWFCGLSAERFKSAFEYTHENQQLWRELLEVTRDIIGPAIQASFCYWATEPLDNPDYEEFISDYHAIVGSLPSTTTALASREMPRARTLIHMWEDRAFVANHFSVLTVKQMDQIHKEFTAEELVFTGMKFVNKGSSVKKATAGRALEKLNRQIENGRNEESDDVKDELTQGTIACVSGFLFNMVEKTIQLISPCKASEQWPKGYKVLSEGSFSSAADVRQLMERMIDENMPVTLTDNDRVRFRDDIHLELLADGFRMSTECWSQTIHDPRYAREFGELVLTGLSTVSQIVEALHPLGISAREIKASIDVLFKNGLLNDELVPD